MDGDPRSYRVPVIRLSDVYTDDEETGAEEPDAVAPWQRNETDAQSPKQTSPPQVPRKKEDEEQRVKQPIVTVEALQASPTPVPQTSPTPNPFLTTRTRAQTEDVVSVRAPSFTGQTDPTPTGFDAPPDTAVPSEPVIEPFVAPQTLDDSVAPTILGEDIIQKLKQRKEVSSSFEPEKPPEAPKNIWEKARATAGNGVSTPSPSFSFGEPTQTASDSLAGTGLPSDDLPDIWEQASAQPAPMPPSYKKVTAPTGPSDSVAASPLSAPSMPSSFDPIDATSTPAPRTTSDWSVPESAAQDAQTGVPLEPTPEPFVPTPPFIPTPPAPQAPPTPTPPFASSPATAAVPGNIESPALAPAESPASQPATAPTEAMSSAPVPPMPIVSTPTSLMPESEVFTEPTFQSTETPLEEGVGTVPIRRAEPSAPSFEQTRSAPQPRVTPPEPVSIPRPQTEVVETPHAEEPKLETPGVVSSVMKAFGVQDAEKEVAPKEEIAPIPPTPAKSVAPQETITADVVSKPVPTQEIATATETELDASGVMSSVMKAFGVPTTPEQEQRPPEVSRARPRVIENVHADLPQERESLRERESPARRGTPASSGGMDGVRTTPTAKDMLMQGVHTPKEDDPLDMWSDSAKKSKRSASRPQPTPESVPLSTPPKPKKEESDGSSMWGIRPSLTPEHTEATQGDGPVDMWGAGNLIPDANTRGSSVGDSESTVSEAQDLDGLDEELAARDSFTSLPESNDVYVKGAKKKERVVEKPSLENPSTGNSLSELRERVLKQSVQDKVPVKRPSTPNSATEGKDEDISATHGLVSGRTGVGMSATTSGGPETRHARALAGVADELKELGGKEAAGDRKRPSNVPKSHSSLPLVRTFRADVEAAVTQGKVSMVGMISAEEKRRSGSTGGVTAQNVARSRLSAKAYIMLGAALVFLTTILLVVGIIVYMVWVRPYLGSGSKNMLAAERMIEYSIEGKSGVVVLTELAALRDEAQGTQGTMTEIRLYSTIGEGGSTQERNRISAPQFVTLIAPSTPPQLLGALQNDFVLGLHQREKSQVFLILSLKDAQFGPARAGMTAWEQSMARDLSPLFGEFEQLRTTQTPVWFTETPQVQATSTATETPAVVPPIRTPQPPENPTFRDYSVANISGRAIVDTAGKAHLLWSATDQATIIIVTDPATLRDIQMRRGVGY
jgi:hypothetical protein